MESQPASSSWWYGVALVPILLGLVWVSWAGLEVTGFSSPGNSGAFPFALISIALVITTWVTAPVFALCLFLDARAIRSNSLDWEPNHYLYGIIGFVHLGALFSVVVYALTIPAGLFYLYQRHQYIGIP